MPKVPLSQGSYQARNVIANAQACFNLYPEGNPQDAPFPVTHYPSPGATILNDYTGQFTGAVRGIYTCSDGHVVAVFDTAVIRYQGEADTTPLVLGNLVSNSGNPVSMCDNGVDLVIVDGSANGYYIPLSQLNTANSLTQIDDAAFYGSTRVDYIDTFLIFNQPGTNNFYTTTSGVLLPFDATYAASKEGWNDHLACACCLHDNIWLLGDTTTEIWYNAGGAAFPFARMPNSILQQGCVAPYSAVIADNSLYWLSQDRWGRNMCMRGEGYSAKRISTFAVEDAWAKYSTLSDAIGMAFQLEGHEQICFYFPSGNAFWVYDASTQFWHNRTYNGLSQPWLPRCMAGWGNTSVTGNPNVIVAGDRTGPRILAISRQNYTDGANVPITRQRAWPHIQAEDGQRVYHSRFAASMSGYQMSPDSVTLDWSDDAGATYGTPVPQTTGGQSNGQYQWRRMGYARDRVYRLTWTGQGECALNGAYVDLGPGAT